MFCMDKKWDAKKRRDDDILSAVLYEQKELQLPRWKQQTTAKGRTTRTTQMQVLLRMTNWTLAS